MARNISSPLVSRTIGLIVAMLALGCGVARADEVADDDVTESEPLIEVTYQVDDEQRTVIGRVVVSDKAGGMLIEGRDGSLSIIEASQVRSTKLPGQEFASLSHDELGEQLLAELPEGFQVYTTSHYVVAYNTSLTYAKWTSSLLERLHRAFTGYWSNQGFELHEPEFPLAIVIYSTEAEYREASRGELGTAAGSIIGYYSLATNRVSMYDLTGSESLRAARNQRASYKTINRMLAQPAAVGLVATIVHEATHQIAFNCGLQTRYADIPLWVVEGMAVYFEAPDLTSSRGWTGIGKVNQVRLDRFRSHLASWDSKVFRLMLMSNKRFRDPQTALDAYADAWALNYYLIRYRPEEFAAYMTSQQAKPPLASFSEESRLAEFEKHFGAVEEVERDFLQRMNRVE